MPSCPYCQATTNGDEDFCPSCGRALGGDATIGATQPAAATTPAAPLSPGPVGQPMGGPPPGQPMGAQPLGGQPPVGQPRAAGGDPFANIAAQMTPERWIVAGATLLAFISMFLPWISASGLGSANGYHSWGWLTFIGWMLGLAVIVTWFIRGNPALTADRVRGAVVVAGVLEFVGAIAYWIANTGTVGFGFGTISVGPSVGLFLAMIAGIATAGIVIYQVMQTRSHSTGSSSSGNTGAPRW